ncbi:MAG TPA: DUF3301 domain-containing protein [Alcanivoracaceae bacterium]|nr:DUF3301 domain-containing protein [Alcanivoracaceae bacterium]
MLNVIFLFLLVFIFTYGWKHQRLKQHVLKQVRLYCHEMDVTLLDDTIALHKRSFFSFAGKRHWRFEFTVTGAERYEGEVLTHQFHIQRITLPPHRFTAQNPNADQRR